MERFFKRNMELPIPMEKNGDITKSINLDISLDELETDHGLRIPISEYNPNI